MKHTAAILCLLLASCTATDYATQGELEHLQGLEAQADAARASGDEPTAAAIDGEAEAFGDNIVMRGLNATYDAFRPIIPDPIEPFVPFFLPFLSRRFRRLTGKSAKKVGESVKNIATGKPGAAMTDIGDALEGMIQTVGLKDSRSDPEDES